MPVHDWTRVDPGIFHAHTLFWLTDISRALNHGVLPADHYALAGPVNDLFEIDEAEPPEEEDNDSADLPTVVHRLESPRNTVTSSSDLAIYRRKQKVITVRHTSDDRVVAMIESVSSANKSSRSAFDEFCRKAAGLIKQGVHLLVVDLFPPTNRDPHDIHAALWDFFAGEEYESESDKPLTQVAYETTGEFTRAYVVPVAVGEALTDMPLFLTYGGCVHVPLEATYASAFEGMPNVSILPLLN